MARSILRIKQWFFLTAGVFYIVTLTGCSALQTSHFIEPEMTVSSQAVASADDVFVAEPFSLVAADSIGLATFGYEIAQWADMVPVDRLVQQN